MLRFWGLHDPLHSVHPGRDDGVHHHHRDSQVGEVGGVHPEILIPPFNRRQYEESWKKMQELRAQIQAQLRLADHLRKLGEQGGGFSYSYILTL